MKTLAPKRTGLAQLTLWDRRGRTRPLSRRFCRPQGAHWQASLLPPTPELNVFAFGRPILLQRFVHVASLTLPLPPLQKQFVSLGCSSTRELPNVDVVQSSRHEPGTSGAASSSE